MIVVALGGAMIVGLAFSHGVTPRHLRRNFDGTFNLGVEWMRRFGRFEAVENVGDCGRLWENVRHI